MTTYASSIYGDLNQSAGRRGKAAAARNEAGPRAAFPLLDDFVTPSVIRGTDRTSEPTTEAGGSVGLDWMRLSGPTEHVQTVLALLCKWFGIDRSEFEQGRGYWFYEDRYTHPSGINLCYTKEPGGRNAEVCTLELTGEAFTHHPIQKILYLNADLHGYGFKGTRVDPRVDWHGDGITIIDDIVTACRAGHHCMLRRWRPKEEYGPSGRTAWGCNLGARESEVFYRFYDKGLEQGDREEGEWIRGELELKGDRAADFLLQLAQMAERGFYEWHKLASGVVFGHVDFRVGDKSQRMNARRRSPFWTDLIADAETIRYKPSESKTSMDKHWGWLTRSVFPALASVMDNTGMDVAQLWDILAKDVDPYTDAMLRPVVYEYVQFFKLGNHQRGHEEFGPVQGAA